MADCCLPPCGQSLCVCGPLYLKQPFCCLAGSYSTFSSTRCSNIVCYVTASAIAFRLISSSKGWVGSFVCSTGIARGVCSGPLTASLYSLYRFLDGEWCHCQQVALNTFAFLGPGEVFQCHAVGVVTGGFTGCPMLKSDAGLLSWLSVVCPSLIGGRLSSLSESDQGVALCWLNLLAANCFLQAYLFLVVVNIRQYNDRVGWLLLALAAHECQAYSQRYPRR